MSRIAAFRQVAQALHLHDLANMYLRCCPSVRQLPGSGVRYRCSRLESIPLAVEMLEKGLTYDLHYLRGLGKIQTVADLGCNVGFFTILLAHLQPGQSLRGLMVDANGDAVEEAAWNAHANASLAGMVALHGLVGEPAGTQEADFYVYTSNICSSREPLGEHTANLKGRWQKLRTPCINVEEQWRRHFADQRCDLLKIDVEGAELDFFKTEGPFLDRVDTIILEWHKWKAQLDDIKPVLQGHGFQLDKIFEDHPELGTCSFRRGK